MKEYYYSKGEKQIGPVSIGELKKIGINKDTLIWYDGLPKWVMASELEELKEIITESVDNSTKPFSEVKAIKPMSKKAKTILVFGGIIILLLIISLLNIYPCSRYYTEYYDFDYDSDIYWNRESGYTFGDIRPELKARVKVYNEESKSGTFYVYATFYGDDYGTISFKSSKKIVGGSNYTFYFSKELQHHESVSFDSYSVTPPEKSERELYEYDGNLFEYLFD